MDDCTLLYQQAVYESVTLFCQRCYAFLEPDSFGKEGWLRRHAEQAKHLGWHVERRASESQVDRPDAETGHDSSGLKVYCPLCAANLASNRAGHYEPKHSRVHLWEAIVVALVGLFALGGWIACLQAFAVRLGG